MRFAVGTRLRSYIVVELLGSGGMGEVYLAHDTLLDRQVALKVLPAHLSEDSGARERLRREARAAAALDHPFICKVFEFCEAEGVQFFVMEFVRGERLDERFRRAQVPLGHAIRIASEISEALEEAHARGVIHRDLKPANIMVTSQGHIKVMDFGIAKRSIQSAAALHATTLTEFDDHLTGPRMAIGTPAYMSPEQIRGEHLDARSDLFSFGIVLCELFTGRHPFHRSSPVDTVTAILRDPPDVFVPDTTEIPRGFLILVKRLLAKDPADRYQAAAAVRTDLDHFPISDAREPDRQATSTRIPLIGRESEFSELLRALTSAIDGRGSLMLIGGEPGIGKTHLTEALLREASRRGCIGITGHCSEMEGAPPYMPFIELVERCVRVLPLDSLRSALGDATPEIAKLMPELRRMFPETAPALDIPPEQQRRFMFNAYREFLARLARVTPIVTILEDLHWADQPTISLLEHLARSCSDVPILLIGTYRDVDLEISRPFASMLETVLRSKLARRISLRRLGTNGVAEMLQQMSGRPAPSQFLQLISSVTEGNPFFVEELYRHLAEEGKLFDRTGDWNVDLSKDELHVPEGVRLVIGRRLERLSDTARSMLTSAAVIGRSFPLRVLEELDTSEPAAVLDAFEAAEKLQLITSESAGRETRYRFVHELVRQTLAERLSLPRRQRLHARIAAALQRLYGSAAEAQASAIAHHLYQAGAAADLDTTVRFLTVAARQAIERAASEEALISVDNALSLMDFDSDPRVADLHLQRGLALRSTERFSDAVEAYERAIELFIRGDRLSESSEASLQLGWLHTWNADPERARAVADRALLSIGPQPSPLRHALLLLRATSFSLGDKTEAALATAEEAKRVEEAIDPTSIHVFAAVCEARVYLSAAQLHRAAERAREAAEVARRSGDRWSEADIFDPIAEAVWMGRPSIAQVLIPEAYARARRVGHQRAAWNFQMFSSQMYMQLGYLEQAERIARETDEFIMQQVTPWSFLSMELVADVLAYRGKLDEAQAWFRRAVDADPKTHLSGMLAGGLFWALAANGSPEAMERLPAAVSHFPLPGKPFSLGATGCVAFTIEGLAQLGRYDQIVPFLDAAEHVVAHGPVCIHNLRLVRTSAGIAAACRQEWSRAEHHHVEAIHQADSGPVCVAQPAARYWYAEMLSQRGESGDRQKAREVLLEARSIAERVGMPWHAAWVSGRLAR